MKKLIIIFLIVLIFIPVTILTYESRENLLLQQAIEKGKLKIDQESHRWNLSKKKETDPVQVFMYLRNRTGMPIDNDIEFRVVLDTKGLEKSFLENALKLMGKNNIIDYEPSLGRRKAIYAYVKRGKKLLEGMRFEPIIKELQEQPYIFSFRQYIELTPGEVKQIKSAVMVPPNKRGYLLSIQAVSLSDED